MKVLNAEDGFALVPALSVTIIVLLLGAALLTTVDVQSNQSASERQQEGSFQLAESALDTQLVQLGRTWPSSAATAYPGCNQSSAASATCSGSSLAANYTAAGPGGSGPNGGSDFTTTPAWTTRVIDDVNGGNYYSDAIATPTAYAYDQNANGAVWVRSEATVDSKRSVLVTLVEQGEPQLEALPQATIIAGWFETTNNGNKVIVNAAGTSGAAAGAVAVRCSTPAPSKDDLCLGYDPGKGQLNPADAYQTGYVDGTGTPNATNRASLDAAALARLKLRAQSLGTYYATGCPPSLTGAMVYVENANCSYTGNASHNSVANPGVLIFAAGTLSLGGTRNYYGLVYMAMGHASAPASGPCTSPTFRYPGVTLGGNSEIHGAILVDKCGGVLAGSSGVNVIFDANVFNNVESIGSAAAVQNSFRIVPTA